ncbi:MAG: hypothetical protein JNJ73_01200 [Hyphomonadaceae bacterium]|nr:hypothetical protein [Hyphomonadaceae bacterium]
MLRTAAIARAAFVAIAFIAADAGAAEQQGAAKPCQGASYRAFDFWIGEWDAYVTGTDNLAGQSSIRSEDSGCVITEHWRSRRAAYSGRSLNTYDRASGKWLQFWMDSNGDLTRFAGNPPSPGQMALVAEDDVSPDNPAPRWRRMTFTRNADGSVRQHGEISSDHGATWSSEYDFTYRPRRE